MSCETCPNCKQYTFSWQNHKCDPAWEACDPEYDETHWIKIHAVDAEDAAQKAARRLDQDDYKPTDHTILVRPYDEDGPITRWDVTHELVVEYHAYMAEEQPAPPVKTESYDEEYVVVTPTDKLDVEMNNEGTGSFPIHRVKKIDRKKSDKEDLP